MIDALHRTFDLAGQKKQFVCLRKHAPAIHRSGRGWRPIQSLAKQLRLHSVRIIEPTKVLEEQVHCLYPLLTENWEKGCVRMHDRRVSTIVGVHRAVDWNMWSAVDGNTGCIHLSITFPPRDDMSACMLPQLGLAPNIRCVVTFCAFRRFWRRSLRTRRRRICQKPAVALSREETTTILARATKRLVFLSVNVCSLVVHTRESTTH